MLFPSKLYQSKSAPNIYIASMQLPYIGCILSVVINGDEGLFQYTVRLIIPTRWPGDRTLLYPLHYSYDNVIRTKLNVERVLRQLFTEKVDNVIM